MDRRTMPMCNHGFMVETNLDLMEILLDILYHRRLHESENNCNRETEKESRRIRELPGPKTKPAYIS